MRASPSILIVEDERIVARDLQQILAGFGYETSRLAASSDEALAHASARRPDLVLMDIRIRGERDGIDTAQRLREQFDVPVIFLTAHADDATLERAKRTQPYGYLIKPINAVELRSAIEVSLSRHEMESRLREREQWMSTTLRSIADAVITVDLAEQITFMNPAAEQLLGCTADEAIGRPAHDVLRLVDTERRALEDTPLARVLRERRPVHVAEVALMTSPDGPIRYISESAAPVVNDDEMLGVVMVLTDITERRKLKEQLERADRLAALGTMAAAVAHELNNPLSIVIANCEYLEDELSTQHEARRDAVFIAPPDPAELEEPLQALRDLHASATRIAKIVTDIRSFARPAPSTPGLADAGQAVEWAVSATAHEFRHRAQLITDLNSVAPIKADQSKLEQVIINLLINAAQVIEPGAVQQNEVRVTTRPSGEDEVVIEVRDTGKGIAPDDLEHIFELFYTTKPIGVGTGLGLAICRDIIASLGGRIEVESELGKGSLFRIVLPATAPEPDEATSAEAPAPNTKRRGRILVIDDDELTLKVMHRILASEHAITCVQSARKAIEMYDRGERFDVICCDLMMPDMTGLAFHEELALRNPEYALRIVFVTAGATSERVDQRLRAVPNLCLKKPFKADHLQNTIQRLLGDPDAP